MSKLTIAAQEMFAIKCFLRGGSQISCGVGSAKHITFYGAKT